MLSLHWAGAGGSVEETGAESKITLKLYIRVIRLLAMYGAVVRRPK